MSNTPRTDALLLNINEGAVYDYDGPVPDLCRELEAALTAANARIAELEKDVWRYLDVIFSIAADGWLMHGPEGMDETQEAVYKVCKEHPTYKRLEAAAMENTNG
jgi:hypothetical protein